MNACELSRLGTLYSCIQINLFYAKMNVATLGGQYGVNDERTM